MRVSRLGLRVQQEVVGAAVRGLRPQPQREHLLPVEGVVEQPHRVPADGQHERFTLPSTMTKHNVRGAPQQSASKSMLIFPIT